MQRRQFIATTGVVATVGLAGCSGGGGSNGPESVVESFYQNLSDLGDNPSQSEVESAVDDLLHSGSPLREVLSFFAGTGGQQTEEAQRSFEGVETEVAEEDLDASEVRDRVNSAGGGIYGEVDGALIESVAEENAVVEAQVSFDNGDERTQEWLVTTEDGDWVIFA